MSPPSELKQRVRRPADPGATDPAKADLVEPLWSAMSRLHTDTQYPLRPPGRSVAAPSPHHPTHTHEAMTEAMMKKIEDDVASTRGTVTARAHLRAQRDAAEADWRGSMMDDHETTVSCPADFIPPCLPTKA